VSRDPRVAVEEEGRRLKISRVRRVQDMGVYQCNASNDFGHVFSNFYLDVQGNSLTD
jgi:Immunoglobulin I-set domain